MIAHLSCLKVSFVETLDQYDRAILQELQQNGRLTNAELAQRVSLSAAPCWRRVRALEAAGFISGYTAVINRRKVGLGVLAFVRLDADRNDDTATRELETALKARAEIIACHYISGKGSFELQVVCQDLDDYAAFARNVLIKLPHVKDLETRFSLGEVKNNAPLSLAHLAKR
jgi:Lrp/AsnC family transcriptional regulator, leucine-responsive regulatory protein